ncbi:hypothetical protein COB52_02150 [Candidatus Kaiserbacteria bacterium]|nr:MAG: hypothetical protein COB52_02150 [Candidatus Kaiserbacteria bacterium]
MKYILPLILGLFILLLFFLAGVDSVNTKKEGTLSTFSTPNNSFESLKAPGYDTTRETKLFFGWESLINPSTQQDVTATLEEKPREVFSVLTNSITKPLGVDYSDLIWLGEYSNSNSSYDNVDVLTPKQEDLHVYGNSLGGILNNFTLSNSGQPEMLSAFFEDRSKTTKLKNLSDNYLSLSKDVAKIKTTEPTSAINSRLMSSYQSVGELLWALSFAENDEELLESLLTYNKSSEEVVKAQLLLISLFGANGVVFENHEPGAMFSFKPSSL